MTGVPFFKDKEWLTHSTTMERDISKIGVLQIELQLGGILIQIYRDYHKYYVIIFFDKL